ncbi:hypothetical protein M0805_003737 [Coniferiporia weirii]|nr:hypothetical protein M0805_003737 [Coniferiporia weirii]
MFPKTLLTAFSLLILATNALAAPALSCPAAGASSSSAVGGASDIASSVAKTSAASSSVAKATQAASSSVKATHAASSSAKATHAVSSSAKAASSSAKATHAASTSAKAATSSAKATHAASTSAKAASSSAKATHAASTSAKAKATSVKSTAVAKSTGASKATGASLAAAPTATGKSSTAASFGSCSSPEIKFAAGLDGRKETAFAPLNTNSFNHGSADAITVITDFICQQLQSKCKANAAALSDCQAGTTAANAAAKGTGAQADAFNAAFGIKTNFANVAVVNNQGKTVSGSSTTAASASATKASSSSALTNGAAASSTSTSTSTSSGSSGSSSDAEQSSTTLDPAVIATGFAQDGQATPAAGQVASLTSTNNFINFCLTVDKPITNGQQIKTGSCNPAPMGVIAATTNMPSSKFTFPTNFGSIKANTAFTVSMAINNIETGNFVNADSNYYSAPQQVNSAGDIIGHSHVVIEQIDSLGSTTLSDPTKFAFFKGINGAAVNGVVTADVTDGLPAGIYRMASINAAANHQPVLVAVAQHGSLDDMVYFTVTN